ncbi:MAG TPA: hypothetical protein VIT21_04185 [Chthoniobacterales bacterium]
MPGIELVTRVVAPAQRVFDLARSIDLHSNSATGTGEQAVASVTSGLIGLGQEGTWRARHFGIWQSLRWWDFIQTTHPFLGCFERCNEPFFQRLP